MKVRLDSCDKDSRYILWYLVFYFTNSMESMSSSNDSFFLLPIKNTISSKKSPLKFGKSKVCPLKEGYKSLHYKIIVSHSPDVLKVFI